MASLNSFLYVYQRLPPMYGLPSGCIHRSLGFALLRADGQLLSWGAAEQRRLSNVRRWGRWGRWQKRWDMGLSD